MTQPAHNPLTLRFVLVLASIIIFAVAAIFFWFVDDITLKTDFGLVAAGLATWAASTVVP
jgi:hypothetical protein